MKRRLDKGDKEKHFTTPVQNKPTLQITWTVNPRGILLLQNIIMTTHQSYGPCEFEQGACVQCLKEEVTK